MQTSVSQESPPSVVSPPVASVQDVTHRYGNAVAIDHAFVDIPAACIVGIVGPDGVGKSTLMALIAGAKRMQQGKLTVLGGDIREARHRAAVSQDRIYAARTGKEPVCVHGGHLHPGDGNFEPGQ